MSADVLSAEVTFSPGGSYKLAIKLPKEQTQGVERSSLTNCKLGAQPDSSETLPFDHPAWTLHIEGVLPNPSDRTQLTGSKTETLTREDQAWLTGRGANVAPQQVRDNGELLPVPVEVTTTWNLTRRR
jgi:hypothetical protein